MGGAGAGIFYLEQEPIKKYMEPEPRKIGSTPQHWWQVLRGGTQPTRGGGVWLVAVQYTVYRLYV